MTPPLTKKPSKTADAASWFLHATIEHEQDAVALGNMNDDQLLSLLRKSLKTSRCSEPAKVAHDVAETFRRIATLLSDQGSGYKQRKHR